MHQFLPLTTDAASRAGATSVLASAQAADAAATSCWTALLAGRTGCRNLPPRLRQLSEATSLYVGTRWWFAEGSAHRKRVARAQNQIEDAVTDGDGQEFALAFVGYDHAMASAVVCAGSRQHGRTFA
ncbi:hypothetical protein [Amycolatopsis suaedae]|uniref:Uncharacterized protein n=1 Tax=Amycolatopsis suaedae TaxID=2510978 RepID=A0A4Q7J987_9PSEU|nr:hypothetical protein [Amycolatopsis suaedae]RZQ63568.1 hypothetical protein EWH70_14205 [Amycolatopsis suaedae]